MKKSYSTLVDHLFAGRSDQAGAMFSDIMQERKSELSESVQQNLMEIRWRSAEVVDSALDAPIQCGFEAEGVWLDLDPLVGEMHGLSLSDFADDLDPDDLRQLEADHEEAIEQHPEFDRYLDMYLDQQRDEFIEEHIGGSQLLDEFLQETGRDVNDYELDDYEAWLGEYFDNNGVADRELAYEEAMDKMHEYYGIDQWLMDEYGNISNALQELDILPDYMNDDQTLSIAMSTLDEWTQSQSKYQHVTVGDYHQTGVNPERQRQDFWRIEPDGSISQDDGAGLEIISPVYDTPREMLSEMFSLFDYLEVRNVVTDSSTGLHITMSMSGETEPMNRLKMAIMLDDPHVLKQFNRINNSYSQSQIEKIQSKARNLKSGDARSLHDLEMLLSPVVTSRLAINFKSKTNTEGHPLVEFRAAGGEGYMADTDRITDTTVRYATVMLLAHDPDAYRREYITKLFRQIARSTEVDSRQIQPGENPVMDTIVQLTRELKFQSQLGREFFNRDPVVILKDIVFRVGVNDYAATINPRIVRLFVSAVKQLGLKYSDLIEMGQTRQRQIGLQKLVGTDQEITDDDRDQA